MKEMKNKVVVITGASSGIGRATALRFAQAGANLVLGARRKSLLKELAAECEQLNVRALSVDTDVSDSGDVERLSRRAIDAFGGIDAWVNNAGVSTFGRFDEIPLEEHRQVIETDLMGCIYGSYEALRQFRQQGKGVLINVSSYLGKDSAPYQSSYVAAKHGIRGLGMALRQELWANDNKDIHVCTVMPVSMDTPFFEHAANHTGKPVQAIPPVYPPEQVSETIFALAMKPKDEVIVGRAGKLFSMQGRFAPITAEKAMAMHTHRRQMRQNASVPDSSGNVLKPTASGTGVRGGWLDNEAARGQRSNGRKVAGSIAALAVPAALTWLLRRRESRVSEGEKLDRVA
ncbi:MAG TPA: SDR family oxidoreductase [Clostridia bacterium]|nr:SDR family oxidoreductase [Clostridia bacterium]